MWRPAEEDRRRFPWKDIIEVEKVSDLVERVKEDKEFCFWWQNSIRGCVKIRSGAQAWLATHREKKFLEFDLIVSKEPKKGEGSRFIRELEEGLRENDKGIQGYLFGGDYSEDMKAWGKKLGLETFRWQHNSEVEVLGRIAE